MISRLIWPASWMAIPHDLRAQSAPDKVDQFPKEMAASSFADFYVLSRGTAAHDSRTRFHLTTSMQSSSCLSSSSRATKDRAD